MTRKTKFAVVLGAGFSKCADLPLAGEVSNLIFCEEFESSLDKTITTAIEEFLKGAFYWERGGLTASLEDIFTMIDLSEFPRGRAGCASNPSRRRSRPTFCSQPIRDGTAQKSGPDSPRTRHPLRGRLWACQLSARFRRSFSSGQWRFSAARSRRASEIPFRPNPEAADFLACGRPGNFSIRSPSRDASGEFGWEFAGDDVRRLWLICWKPKIFETRYLVSYG
jgi:hypothetical protein